MTPSERKESRELVALTALLRDSASTPTVPELERGLDRLRRRLAGSSSWRLRFVWLALAVTVLVSLALGITAMRAPRRSPGASPVPVAVAKVEGGKLVEGGYLSELGDAGVSLVFNEGTEFRLLPGARGRLRRLDDDGARFSLEHGVASFRITASRERKWVVEAGPFLVTVRGTDFSVAWDPRSEQFGVKLRRGRVVVSGPVLGEDLALRPGQNLSVDLRAAQTTITEARAGEAAVDEAPPAASAADSTPPVVVRPKPELSSAHAAPRVAESGAAAGERRWAEALAHGDWDRILADAARAGLDATLQTASSEELMALADAARYRRRADWARAALLAQRRRFPGAARSLDALFMLGRVEELRANGGPAAISWYDQYLTRASAGTYAAEALGRKMVLTNGTGGPVLARPIADDYLRRFPRGSYAGAARALRREP